MGRNSNFPKLIKWLQQMSLDDHLIYPYESDANIPALRKCMTNTGKQLGHHFKSILSDEYLHIVRIR